MPATSPVARALLAGEAVRADAAEVRKLLPMGEAQDLLTALAPESAVCLPLRGRGRTLGVLTLYAGVGESLVREDMATAQDVARSEEHTSELQSRQYLVCRLLLEKK